MLFSFFFTFSVFASEDVLTYQKLKNVTRGDNPSGLTTTVGFEGDTVRYLVYLKNTSFERKTFTVQETLSVNLEYIPGSSKYYKQFQGEWKKLPNSDQFLLKNHQVQLDPDEWIYFTFHTKIKNLPENNSVIANFSKILDDQGNVLDQTVTKILAPNVSLKELLASNKNVGDYEKRVLEEEFAFIEQAFQHQLQAPVQQEKIEEHDYIQWGIFIASFIVFTSLIFFYVQKNHF